MEASIHWQILGTAGVLSVLLGLLAARTHFCTMGSVSDWLNIGSLDRLRAWLLAIAVALGAVTMLETTGHIDLSASFPPYRQAAFVWPRYLLGGFLFGIGMTLAAGCINKNLIRLGAGSLKSLAVLIVSGGVAYAMMWTNLYATVFASWMTPLSIDFGAPGQGLDVLLAVMLGLTPSLQVRSVLAGVVVLALLAFCLRSVSFRADRACWGSGLGVGLLVAAGWWLTGGALGAEWKDWADMIDTPPARVAAQSFTFTSALGDGARYLREPGNVWLISFSVVSLLGVVLGAFIDAILSRRFRIDWFPNLADFRNNMLGAVLMGIGGALAMGCSIGQGITGMSTLAAGSLLSMLAIIGGSALTMRIQYYYL